MQSKNTRANVTMERYFLHRLDLIYTNKLVRRSWRFSIGSGEYEQTLNPYSASCQLSQPHLSRCRRSRAALTVTSAQLLIARLWNFSGNKGSFNRLSHYEPKKSAGVCNRDRITQHIFQVSALGQCSLTAALGRATCKRKES